MFHSRRRSIPAMVAGAIGVGGALGLGPAAFADDAQSTQQLREQIQALQTRLDQLETGQKAQSAAREKADKAAAVDAAIAGVLDDAERRSNPVALQAQGFTAGYTGGKFLIQSEDGAFVLNPNVQFQFRYVANNRETGDDDDNSNEWENGFEVRRLKLSLDGNVFSKNTVYKFQWATARNGGGLALEEAWVRHSFGEDFWGGKLSDFAIRAGQFKDFTFHEEITSSKRQLAVDRSLLNETIAGGLTDYEQGVTFIYDPKTSPLGDVAMRAEVGFIDGANSDNTNFTNAGGPSAAGITAVNWGVVGRADFKLSGDWKNYDDFTARKTTDYLAVIGGGFNYTEGEGGQALFHTVDVQWEPANVVPGLGVYAAYVGLLSDLTAGGDDDSLYHWGFLVQAGYMVSDDWEVFGRYDYTDLDSGPGGPSTLAGGAAVEDSLHEFTLGVNYYMKDHASKLTADFTWLPNGSPLNQDGIGVLNSGGEDQVLFRVQYQLLL